MRIKLTKDIRHYLILSCAGKTMAEKRMRYEMQGTSSQFSYERKLVRFQGQWMEVDTKYLFNGAFNGILEDGSLIHVDGTWLVDEVDISPEFKTFDEWVGAVQKRYDKDWPGNKVEHRMITLFKKRVLTVV